MSPDGVLPQKEHTPLVDGRLVIDIPLSEDFITTYQAMEKVRTVEQVVCGLTDTFSSSTKVWSGASASPTSTSTA